MQRKGNDQKTNFEYVGNKASERYYNYLDKRLYAIQKSTRTSVKYPLWQKLVEKLRIKFRWFYYFRIDPIYLYNDPDEQIYAIQQSTRTTFRRLQPLHEYFRQKSPWYYKWHIRPISHKIHFAILISYTLLIFCGLIFSLGSSVEPTKAYSCSSYENLGEVGWADPNTWQNCNGGTPSSGDSVVISAGTTVYNDAFDVTVSSLTIDDGADLSLFDYNITVSGDVTANGMLVGNGRTLTVGGNFYNYGISGTTFFDPDVTSMTLVFNGNSSGKEIAAGGFRGSLGKVLIDGSGGEWTLIDDLYTTNTSISGDLEIKNGTLVQSSYNLSIGGNISLATNGGNGSFTKGSGWMGNNNTAQIYDGKVTPSDLGIYLVANPLTLMSNVTVTTIEIQPGQSLNMGTNNYTLTITGSGTPFANSGTFTKGTGSTVKYTGTSSTNVTTVAYQNIEVNPSSGSATYSLAGHQTNTNAIAGNLIIGSNATLNLNTKNLTVTGTFSNNGILKMNGTETTTLTNDTDSGTVEYAATTGSIEIKNWTYNKLSINGTGGTFKVPDNITVNNNLDVTAGTFDSENLLGTDYNLTILGNATISSTLDANSSTITVSGGWNLGTTGSFTKGTSTIVLAGTSGNIDATGTGGWTSTAFYNLTINDGRTATFTDSTGISGGALNIVSGGAVTGNVYMYFTGGATITNPPTSTSVTVANIIVDNSNQTMNLGDLSGTNTLMFRGWNTGGSTGTITLSGNLTAKAITITNNPSTNTLSTTALNTSPNNYSITATSLTIGESGLQDFGKLIANDSAIDINGNVLIYGHASNIIDADTSAWTVSGNWTNNANGTFTADTSSISFDSSTADQTITTDNDPFYDLTLNNTFATGDAIISGSLDANHDLTVTDGNLDLATNDPAVTIAGDLTINANGTWTKQNNSPVSTVSFDGGSSSYITDNTVSKQNLGKVIASDAEVFLNSDIKLDIFQLDAAVNIDGQTMELANVGTVADVFINNSDIISGSGTFKFSATNSGGNISIPSTFYYYNLKFSGSETYELAGSLLGGNLNNVTIDSGATLSTSSQNYDISLKGNWTNAGTFTPGTGTVSFVGTDPSIITGETTFYDLVMDTNSDGAKELRFSNGSNQTISHTWTLDGASGKSLTLKSTVDGSEWFFTIPSGFTSGDFISVRDSWSTDTNKITAGSNVTNVSNNDGWIFNQAPVNDSLTFTNPYSGTTKTAVSDDTTVWNFEVKVTDQDGPTDLNYIELNTGNGTDNNPDPLYESIKLKWTRGASTEFTEEADTQNSITLVSSNSDATSNGNQWTINFKIKINDQFSTFDTDYGIQVISHDQVASVTNNYALAYKVTNLFINFDVDRLSLDFSLLLPGSIITDYTKTTVSTNYPQGYSVSISDSVSGSYSSLLHSDTTTRIPDYTGTIATPTSWNGVGLGICVYSATNKDSKWGAGTTADDLNNKYAGIPQNSTVITTKSGNPTVNDEAYVGYKLVVGNAQKTGSYSGDIVYSVTGLLN